MAWFPSKDDPNLLVPSEITYFAKPRKYAAYKKDALAKTYQPGEAITYL
jgi:hypothetical protein